MKSFIPYFLISIGAFAITFSGCGRRDDPHVEILSQITNGIKMFYTVRRNETRQQYRAFEEKAKAVRTQKIAMSWKPKVLILKDISQCIFDTIDLVIAKVSENHFHENSVVLLQNKVERFVNKLMIIDPEWYAILKKQNIESFNLLSQIKILPSSTDATKFDKSLKENYEAILAHIQSCIAELEYKTLEFFNYKSDLIDESYSSFSAIVGQSTNVVLKGEDLSITAGVGTFTRATSQEIFIANKRIEKDDGNVATYTFKPNGRIGRHSIPVRIQYIDSDGVQKKHSWMITYTIKQ